MKLNNKKAFTLIELMIVVIIIGILAAIAIPAYQNFVIESKIAESSVQLDSLKTDQTAFYAESQVNSSGGYQTQSFYNVGAANALPATIPAQTKLTADFCSVLAWSSIRFCPTDPLFFQYQSASATPAANITNTATADLKAGTGAYTIRTMTGNITNGAPSWGAIAKTSNE